MVARSALGRELLGAVALIVLLITGLALWTGTMPPLVVVESGSMMHSDSGEVGAIDPGDLVLLMDVDDQTVIHTYVEERMRSNPIEQHGKGGDVIIYDKNGAGGLQSFIEPCSKCKPRGLVLQTHRTLAMAHGTRFM